MGVFQTAGASCTVRTGPHSMPMPAGETVASLRAKLELVYPVDQRAKPYIGTQEVANSYVVQAGQELTFIAPTGQKG